MTSRYQRVHRIRAATVVAVAGALLGQAWVDGVVAKGPDAGVLQPRPCNAAGASVLAANERGTLIKRERFGRELGEGDQLLIYACARRGGRPLRVYRCAAQTCAVPGVAMGGCYAAIGASEGSRDPGAGAARVIRLNLCRRSISRLALRRPTTGAHGGDHTNVTDVVVTRAGSVAWIWATQYVDPNGMIEPVTYEVHKVNGHGETQLDSSPDIDYRSLALSGSRLYWMKAGLPQTAILD